MRKFYDFGIISDFGFDIIIDLLSLIEILNEIRFLMMKKVLMMKINFCIFCNMVSNSSI